MENITESNLRCQIEVLRVKKSDQNCWNWIIYYIFMQKSEKLEMTPGVFYTQYLCFYLAKIENQGQFWNPQISKLIKSEDFKTDFTFLISSRFVGDIDKKQTWEFFCELPVETAVQKDYSQKSILSIPKKLSYNCCHQDLSQ